MTGLWLLSYVALWIVMLLVVAMLVGVLRHIGMLYEQAGRRSPPATKLRAGDVVPDVTLSTLDGVKVRLSRFAGTSAHLVLVSPQCSGCADLLKQLAESDATAEVEGKRVIVSMGDPMGTEELLRRAGAPADGVVLIDREGRIKDAWGVRATPVTIVVDEQLKVLRQVIGAVDARQLPPLPQTSLASVSD
jgi:peroxiredoxin